MKLRSPHIIALLGLLALNALALEKDKLTGLHGLDSFVAAKQLQPGERIIGMVGFYGQDQPQQWFVLTDNPAKGSALRETVVAQGKILAERKFRRLPGQDLPTIPLIREKLKIDSTRAFELANREADANKVGFESVHYQLRCRDIRDEPVWMLNLLDESHASVGVVYISAETGNLLRVTWLKAPAESFTTTPQAERNG
ncbi:MAG: hypothetical protein AAF236_01865 [Verrucomicrobiota bacterium]